jgi:hypothetical protein
MTAFEFGLIKGGAAIHTRPADFMRKAWSIGLEGPKYYRNAIKRSRSVKELAEIASKLKGK